MLIARGSSDLTAFRDVYISSLLQFVLQYKLTYAGTGDFVMHHMLILFIIVISAIIFS